MRMPRRADAVRSLEGALRPIGRRLQDRRVGPDGSIARAPELDGPAGISLTSESFRDGEEIPDRHAGAGIGHGVSPQLRWTGVPEGARRLLLIVEDLDFPSRTHSGLHCAAVFEPTGPEGEIVEGALVAGASRFAFCADYRGRTGFAPPRPLPGHGTHRYAFHLYALDNPITPPDRTPLKDLLRLVTGHVLASGHLMGTKTA